MSSRLLTNVMLLFYKITFFTLLIARLVYFLIVDHVTQTVADSYTGFSKMPCFKFTREIITQLMNSRLEQREAQGLKLYKAARKK